MAMRKICNICGAINKPDEYDCWYCKNDIADEEKTSIPNTQIGYKFFNNATGEFISNAPNAISSITASKNENPTPSESPIAPDPTIDSRKDNVKICKVCQKINSPTALECECGASLRRITAQVVASQIAAQNTQEDSLIIDDFSFNDEPEYQLIIGVNGENRVPVSFNNGVYPIGRDYQECLENSRYISRCHCFLKQMDSGDIYLAERSNAPSTNGTFLRKIGERRERLIPGKGYKISTGSVFYLGDTPVLFFKRS